MPTEPEPLSLFDVAKRAVEVCDPPGTDANLGDFLMQFEDDDEPISSVENVEERVAIASEGVDADITDPAVQMAGAVILYLARRRDEIDDDPDHILRLSARAEYKGEPPEFIQDWLNDRGVSV
jgi:hypothetical protein